MTMDARTARGVKHSACLSRHRQWTRTSGRRRAPACSTPPGSAAFRAATSPTSTSTVRSSLIDELKAPIYPKHPDAPLCACFGFTYDEVAADVRDGTPTRIRELLAKSKSPAARCRTLAADGKCCMSAVQELYMKLRSRE